MTRPPVMQGDAPTLPGHSVLRPAHSDGERKDDCLVRLRRIEGQVRGIERMVEEDQYCPNVVTQVAAATRALQEVAVELLDDHIRRCAMAVAERSGTEDAFDEVARTIRLAVRL